MCDYLMVYHHEAMKEQRYSLLQCPYAGSMHHCLMACRHSTIDFETTLYDGDSTLKNLFQHQAMCGIKVR